MQREMPRRERFLLITVVAAVAAFVADAWLVGAGAWSQIDQAILLWGRAHSSRFLDWTMLWLSTIGHGAVLLPLIGVFVLWSLLDRDYPGAEVLTVVGIGTEVLTRLLKLGFERARPELWPRVPALSFAFPSGHAMASIAIFGTLAAILARRRPALARPAWVMFVILGVSIGLSRIYLGVHWPSDVLGGWLLGIALFATGLLALEHTHLVTGRTTEPVTLVKSPPHAGSYM
jgi:membrane-associated phospholipid phosphatase